MKELFAKIRVKLPEHSIMEHEIAKVLSISIESAYALVRQQIVLTASQAIALSRVFGISLDTLESKQPNVIPFQFNGFSYNHNNFEDYFNAILSQFSQANIWGKRQMTYAASEFPIFTLFQFPEVAAFKLFFWGRIVYDLPKFRNQQFSISAFDETMLELGTRSWQYYLDFPSVEIWSSNIVNDILTQIYYFWANGIFKSKKDALVVCEKVEELLLHVEQQAVISRKYAVNKRPPRIENYELYYNDVAVSNNTILIKTPNQEQVIVSQNALNYLVTDHEIFFMQTNSWLHQLKNQSIKISGTNEQLRKNFFSRMNSNVEFIKREIEKA